MADPDCCLKKPRSQLLVHGWLVGGLGGLGFCTHKNPNPLHFPGSVRNPNHRHQKKNRKCSSNRMFLIKHVDYQAGQIIQTPKKPATAMVMVSTVFSAAARFATRFFLLFVATTHMWTSWSIVRWPLTKFMMLGAEHKSPGVVFAVLEWSSKLGWIWEDMPKPTGKWTCIFVWKIFLMLSFSKPPFKKSWAIAWGLVFWVDGNLVLFCFIHFTKYDWLPPKKSKPEG